MTIGSEYRVRELVCRSDSEPSRVRVKVSHVIVECGMINHHPDYSDFSCIYSPGTNVTRAGERILGAW